MDFFQKAGEKSPVFFKSPQFQKYRVALGAYALDKGGFFYYNI